MPEDIKLAYSIQELSRMSGLGRTFLYEEVSRGRLVLTKAGRRSIVLRDDALAWIAKLPKLARSPSTKGGRDE